MDQAEKMLFIAASNYSKSKNVSLSKVAWALSALMQKPEHNVYHKLTLIDGEPITERGKDVDKLRTLSEKVDFGDEPVLDDDGDKLENRLGEIVTVEVLSVKTFGAVCKVQNSTRTLLLHLSEVASEFITDVRDYVKEGDTFQAMLIKNPRDELGLSTRKLGSLSTCGQQHNTKEDS